MTLFIDQRKSFFERVSTRTQGKRNGSVCQQWLPSTYQKSELLHVGQLLWRGGLLVLVFGEPRLSHLKKWRAGNYLKHYFEHKLYIMRLPLRHGQEKIVERFVSGVEGYRMSLRCIFMLHRVWRRRSLVVFLPACSDVTISCFSL